MASSSVPDPERPATPESAAPGEVEGALIGRYKLLQRLGEGGFGTVWMAEQQEPVRRRVALKIIKLGMDTRQVVARFEAERQALALMDHPGIARVFDGGATETGRPYFVMELVKGVPITQHCDAVRASLRERLELLREVCHAVQHAHQKGVIHRDIKPSNLLVTQHDGRPVPVVIDFGVAKATGGSLTDRTLFTELRQWIGTPAYMAPEQAEPTSLDIDTRADIYSLGVVLYELVTGTRPFDLTQLLAGGYAEVLRVIREVDPPRPSTRVSTLGDGVTAIAEHRRVPARQLGRLMRGDIDWIVMRALEKDRSRRYDSASALAEDIGRFLEDRPVLASPPGTLYRAAKYVRRHRLGTAAGGLVALALLVGCALAWLGYREATRGRDAALQAGETARAEKGAAELARAEEQAQRERAEKGEREARTEQARATAVLELLRSMLASADPYQLKGRDYTVRQLLGDFDRDFGRGLSVEPAVEATIRGTIGSAFLGLGLADLAEPYLAAALELERRHFGESDPRTLDGLLDWAALLETRARYREAEDALRTVLAARQAEIPADPAGVAEAQRRLATILEFEGRLAEAEELAREQLALTRDHFGESAPEVVTALASLASTLEMRDLPAAEAMQRDVLARCEAQFGPEDPQTAAALEELAHTLLERGQLAEAEEHQRRGLAIQQGVFGEDHPNSAIALQALAGIEAARNDLAQAEQDARRALELLRASFGEEHPAVASCYSSVGSILFLRGDHPGALELAQKALAVHERLHPGDHPDIAVGLHNVAGFLLEHDLLAEAERMAAESLAMQRRLFGDEHPLIAFALHAEARVLARRGSYAEAEERERECLAMRRELLGDAHPSLVEALNTLGELRQLQGDLAGARGHFREALDVARVHYDSAGRQVATALNNLALLLYTEGRWREAEPLFGEALALYRDDLGEQHPHVAAVQLNLVLVKQALGALGEAETLCRGVVESLRAVRGEEHTDVANALAILGTIVNAEGRGGEALVHLRRALAIQRASLGASHPVTLGTLRVLATVASLNAELREAAACARELAELESEARGADSAEVVDARALLGVSLADAALAEQDLPAAREALLVLRDVLARREQGLPAGDWRTANAESALGGAVGAAALLDRALTAAEREVALAEAGGLLASAAASLESGTSAPVPWNAISRRDAVWRLARFHALWSAQAPGEERAAQADLWRAKLAGLEPPPGTSDREP